MVVGAIGLASVIPPLAEVGILFGLVQIGWFVWLGVAMLRPAERSEQLPVLAAEPA